MEETAITIQPTKGPALRVGVGKTGEVYPPILQIGGFFADRNPTFLHQKFNPISNTSLSEKFDCKIVPHLHIHRALSSVFAGVLKTVRKTFNDFNKEQVGVEI
ncbi:Uncharacterized protein Fot_15028 [Forsythia ovata]|uniref:Uncharacterized protein n=1 Tax=Forsythia ovata TaxID=205694 RepID=A0ABD1WBM6_9LAMI